MSERDRYIPGVPCWADTSQPDPQAAVDFYGGVFGWEFEDMMAPQAAGRYYTARLDNRDVAAVGSQPEGAPSAAAWNTYIWVESADETAKKVWGAGGRVVTEPFDVMDAGRMAVFADPAGAVFCAWEPRRHRGAQLVNQHGSVNFNDLHTPDPEGAKAFYGAVFGWETLDMGGGYAMWTLAGYGDHLEQDDPGLRARIRELGAPEGFEDVVASLAPIADDGTPPHWGVTFAVDDADAIAATAAELGGTVLVAPMDAPWVRTTVIADPQGATFVASRFVPENSSLAEGAREASGAARS